MRLLLCTLQTISQLYQLPLAMNFVACFLYMLNKLIFGISSSSHNKLIFRDLIVAFLAHMKSYFRVCLFNLILLIGCSGSSSPEHSFQVF